MRKIGDRKNTFLPKAIFMLVFLILGGSIFYYDISKSDKEIKTLNNIYKIILFKDSINSSIYSTYFPKDLRGYKYFQYIELVNGKKYQISIKSNITSAKICFGDIAKCGVIVKKESDSDILIIKTGNLKYEYIIRTY